MANGSFNIGTSNQYILGTLAWGGTGRVSDNKTPVYFELRFSRTNSGFTTTGSGWFTVKVNGSPVNVNPSNFTLTQNSNTLVLNGTVEVEHDPNGSKYCVIEVSGGTNVFSVTTTSAGFWLDNIPRAATVSAATDFVSNQNPTIWYDNPGGFPLNARLEFGGVSIHRENITQGAAYTFVLTQAEKDLLFSKCPNSETLAVRMVIGTKYDGVNETAWSWLDKTMTVESGNPTIGSFVAEMINNAVPADWGIYVQTKSQCKLTISGSSGKYGSSIVSTNISGGGFNGGSTGVLTTGLLPTSGVITFTATITDSRGRTATAQASVTVVPYTNPSISNVKSQRCLTDGLLDDNGTYVKVKGTFLFSSCNGKNTTSQKVYFRKSGDVDWIDAGSITSNIEKVIGGGSISDEFSYEIKYSISDYFTSTEFPDVVSSGFFTMDYRRGGKGIAVGKAAERDGFDVAMDADFLGALKSRGQPLTNAEGNIAVQDTRSVNTPTNLGEMGVRFDLKLNTTDGLNDGGTFHVVQTIQQWSDSSGGTIHQLGMTDNNSLYMRTAPIGGSWGSWKKLVTDDLLIPTTYAPAVNSWGNGTYYTKTRTKIVTVMVNSYAPGFGQSGWVPIAQLPVGIRPILYLPFVSWEATTGTMTWGYLNPDDGQIYINSPLVGKLHNAVISYYLP